MNWIRQLLASFTLIVGLADPSAVRAQEFFFKPKVRVVFYGDSITEQRGYTLYIEYYLATRLPDWDLVFFNAGASGDTARGGNARLARDVLSENPTAVTINFGMNDGAYKPFAPAIHNRYLDEQSQMVQALMAKGIRVALLTTSPVEARKRSDGDAYNDTLGRFAADLKGIGRKHGAVFVDQFQPELKVLRKMEADGTKFFCFPDGVHTGSLGDLLIAYQILKGLNAPALVSAATLSPEGKVGRSQRCQIAKVASKDGVLSFERRDEALPMIFALDQRLLLPYLDFFGDLNDYGLQATGLSAEKYLLAVDGKKVGIFSREQLDKGINLAGYPLGPLDDQSAKIKQRLAELGHLTYYRFKNTRPLSAISLPGAFDAERRMLNDRRQELLTLTTKMIEARRQAIRELAAPTPHMWSLSPVLSK